MKILLITDNHTPEGGAEKYFFDLKSRLKSLPHTQVHSLGFSPAPESGPDYLILKSAKSNLSKLIWRCFVHPFMYLKIRRALKKINPDIIHLHNIKQYPITLLRAVAGYNVIQTVHDYSPLCPTGQNIHRDQKPCPTGFSQSCFWQHQVKFNKLIYLALTFSFLKTRKLLKRHVKQFLAPSPLLMDYLHRNHFQNATYIPPFIQHHPMNASAPRPNHFLFAGNLGTHKGTDLLLNEFALALKTRPDLVLNIAGAGPDEAKMRKWAQDLNITPQVRFLGWQKHMAPFYMENTAVIFPSIGMESFGLVITEAMSYARPVIGINRGTSAWLITDKENGLLFDPDIRGDLAQKIVTLANDTAMARQLGNTGFKKLQGRFENDNTLGQILSAYREFASAPAFAGEALTNNYNERNGN